MNIHEIERAAFTSCPVQDQSTVSGIVLRSNGGYTKRANSANILSDIKEDPSQLVRTCESYFSTRGLPSIFRVVSGFEYGIIDLHLSNEGYEMIETTNVMCQSLSPAKSGALSIEEMPLSAWVDNFYAISADSREHQQAHLSMLRNISSSCFAAAMSNQQGSIVAMGLGVVENGYFGIFNIVTAAEFKQQGYAFTLISDLLTWAKSVAAHTAYVQVRQANIPGVKLYQKLGYEEAYYYWYRVGGGYHA